LPLVDFVPFVCLHASVGFVELFINSLFFFSSFCACVRSCLAVFLCTRGRGHGPGRGRDTVGGRGGVVQLDVIPKSPSGKILRRFLVDRDRAGEFKK